jgi:hypothetical protein
VKENKIDVLIPMWEEILYISKFQDQFPKECKIFASPFDLIHTLHNKYLFIQKQKELGFITPKTTLITSQDDILRLPPDKNYILKLCYSRASQNMYRLGPTRPVPNLNHDKTNPWIAQEWLTGKKYCSYSVAQNGKLKAHTLYPVNFAIDDSSCLTFVAIEHEKILRWIETFIKKTNFTGQVGFDFIEDDTGTVFAIECNPRGTSGIHLFQTKNRIDRAFLTDEEILITPEIGYTKQIFTGMVMYGWKGKGSCQFLSKLVKTPDVVFDREDLAPFFLQPLLLFNYLKWCVKYKAPLPEAFTYDLNWNGDGQTNASLRN